jgi:16S rRNA (guanine527-N7)-methyltransferase
MPEIISKYFPWLSPRQVEQVSLLKPLYASWNTRINVISRKDIGNFYIHHVLHSLSVARIISFLPGTQVLDAGTGGGFPGIPLAILFPEVNFTLLDSVGKKIKVVSAVAGELGLKNVNAVKKRIEEEENRFDFIVSRAVTGFRELQRVTRDKILPRCNNSLPNGLICLKGGDIDKEVGPFTGKIRVWDISAMFEEPFFKNKKVIHMPL